MKNKLFKDTFGHNLLFVTLITFMIEVIFRLVSDFELFSFSTLRILISTFILAFIVTLISSLMNKKWLRNTINLLYILIYAIYAWLQIGFINYLGVYISFNTSSQFGAVTDYIGDYLASFKLSYYFVFIPFLLAVIICFIFRNKTYNKFQLNGKSILLFLLFIISIFGYYATNKISFMQNKLQIKTNIQLLKNPDVPTVAVNQFGVTVFGLLDLKSFLLPTSEIEHEFINTPQEEQKVVNREVSPFLSELAKEETNKKYSTLNNYFASQKISDYNDYTGMFEGKNVVVLLLESVGDAMINEEYFPNFYKMYSEGWHWTNNYSPRNSCATGNNEFSAMTSLYSIYNTCTSNVYRNNTYYESIFGLFNNKGYRTNSFHDFVAWYYRRDVIHPNMGSGKYYDSNKLGIKTAGYYGEWPSDIEFVDKAFNIILNDESDKPFMTWLTTVTSHQPYSNSSTYGDLHRDYFKKEGYSNTVSRYLSKLKVVDDALGLLLQKLEEKGELENTVIVMLADHYPYGLNKSQVKEMIKYDITDYDIEKTPFVIYNPTMEAKEFTEYNSYINLVPTIANLLNLDYDPRLYLGTDLLSSDYESRVVFADGSWKNEKAYYNATTSKIKYYGEDTYTDEEIKNINQKVGLQIDMSSKAIKANYFNYLEKKLKEYNDKHIEETIENELEDQNENNSVNSAE